MKTEPDPDKMTGMEKQSANGQDLQAPSERSAPS